MNNSKSKLHSIKFEVYVFIEENKYGYLVYFSEGERWIN